MQVAAATAAAPTPPRSRAIAVAVAPRPRLPLPRPPCAPRPRPLLLPGTNATLLISNTTKSRPRAAASSSSSSPSPPQLASAGAFAPLAATFCAATVVYTLLQTLKDSLLVASCGAEALPFASLLLVLPASVAYASLYDGLARALPRRWLFAAGLAPLFACYVLFALFAPQVPEIMAPATALLEPLRQAAPRGLQPAVALLAAWPIAAFYTCAELWGSVAISVLFWSLADDAVPEEEASTVFPRLGIVANLGLVFAGFATRWATAAAAKMAAGGSNSSDVVLSAADALSVRLLTALMLVMLLLLLAGKARVDAWLAASKSRGAPTPEQQKDSGSVAASAAWSSPSSPPEPIGVTPPTTRPPSASDDNKQQHHPQKGAAAEDDSSSSLAVLRSSRRARNVALLVVGYALAHKLFEFAWKGALREVCSDVGSYSRALGDVASLTGALTIAGMLTARRVFRRFGWRGAALATPLAMAIPGSAFFAASAAAAALAAGGDVSGAAAASAAAVVAGALAQILCRAAKYALFDPSKEAVFIRIAAVEGGEAKRRAKAAVDLVGNQAGKTGGAATVQALVMVFGSTAAAAPASAALFAGSVAAWCKAAGELAREMDALPPALKAEKPEPPPPQPEGAS